MASQNQPQRETSPQSSRSRRTLMACVRCRSRKVKCIPLDNQRICQRCCEVGLEHECEFISVAEEENRLSRPQDQEPAHEDHPIILTVGTPPVQSHGRMPRLGESSSTDPTVALPPLGPGYFHAHGDFNPEYAAPSYPHYSLWPSQTPSTSTSTMPNNATPSYAHNNVAYNADQGMRAAVIMRDQEFPGGYNYDQNYYGQDNQKQWYNDGA